MLREFKPLPFLSFERFMESLFQRKAVGWFKSPETVVACKGDLTMGDSSTKSLNYENFCFSCKNYQFENGVCSKIHQNIKMYPKRFYKKCGGHYFIQDNEKPIVNEADLSNIKETYPTMKRRIGCGLLLLLCAVGIFSQHNIVRDIKENWAFALGEIIAFIVMILIGIKFIRGKIVK